MVWDYNITHLARIVNIATRLIGRDQNQLSKMYNVALKRKAIQIFHTSVREASKSTHGEKKPLEKIFHYLSNFYFDARLGI